MDFRSNELLRNGSGYIDPTAYAAMKNFDKEQRCMQYKRGRIFEYDVKPGDTKTALIVSADHRAGDDWLNIIILADERKSDTNIPVAGFFADCGAVSFAWANRFGGYIDKASDAEMRNIDAGIMYALGLESKSEQKTVSVTPPPSEPQNFAVELAEAKTEARIYRELYERLMGDFAGCGKS